MLQEYMIISTRHPDLLDDHESDNQTTLTSPRSPPIISIHPLPLHRQTTSEQVRARRYRPFPSFPEDYAPRNFPDYVARVDPVHARRFDDTDERKEGAYWHKVCNHLVVEKEEERDSNIVARGLVEGKDVSSKDEES
jgi:hypothetical protein